MPKKKEVNEVKEKKVSMYDPSENAFREIPVSLAKKFVDSAKEVEKQLKEE